MQNTYFFKLYGRFFGDVIKIYAKYTRHCGTCYLKKNRFKFDQTKFNVINENIDKGHCMYNYDYTTFPF